MEELNKYAIRGDFKILIDTPTQKTEMSALSHRDDKYIIIPERNLYTLVDIRWFDPDFFDIALKHVFGDKEKNIPGYFQEALRGGASEIYKDKIETVGDKIKIH